MALIQSQPDQLSRTYAMSLFELADRQGGQSAIEDVLGEVEDMLELARQIPGFGEFLSSRVLSTETRGVAIEKIFDGRASPLLVRFLRVLNAKDRLAHLPAIAASLDQLVQERFGRVEVDVYTAEPVDGQELAAIRTQLGEALGKQVIVHPYTDAEMIGGVRVRIGDRLIDGSLASRLASLRQQMLTHGSAELRSRIGRILEAGSEGE